MQDHRVPSSHRAKIAEDILCAASYISLLPAIAMLILPRTRCNRRIRFHACQSVLLNWLLMSVGFLLYLRAGMDRLLDVGSGARFEWTARILCMFVWSFASLSLARGGEFRIPFLASLAETGERMVVPPARETQCRGPSHRGIQAKGSDATLQLRNARLLKVLRDSYSRRTFVLGRKCRNLRVSRSASACGWAKP